MKNRILKKLIAVTGAVVMFLGVTTGSVNAAPMSEVDGEGYTMVTSAAQLDAIRSNPSGKYRLYADIDLAGYSSGSTNTTKGWYPIGSGYGDGFKGELDGNGHTIKNLWSKQAIINTGLFAVTNGAAIKNLNVELTDAGISGIYEIGALVGDARGETVIDNCHISGGSIKATGGDHAGGLIGRADGNARTKIKNSTVTDTRIQASGAYVGGIIGAAKNIDIMNCYADETMSIGSSYVGGLAGRVDAQSSIVNCIATGNVNAKKAYAGGLVGAVYEQSILSKCRAYGAVDAAASYAGGLAGAVYGASEINNGYAFGDVNARSGVGGLIGIVSGKSTIFRSCAYGNVVAKNNYAGGLVGLADTSILSNTYARGNVKGTTGVGGLVGSFSGLGTYNMSVTNSYSSGKVSGYGTREVGSYSGGRTDVEFLGTNYYDQQTSGVSRAHGFGGSPIGDASAFPQGKGTVSMMKQGTFAGWDFTNIWSIDEDETYPYFEILQPSLSLDIKGNLKENRKFTITGNYTDSDFIGVKDIEITVTPLSGGASADAIKIDTDTETNTFKELIIKQAGEYQVTMTAKCLLETKTIIQNITIVEDEPPIARIDFFVAQSYNPMKGYVEVNNSFEASSPDGDTVKAEWLVYFDDNEDGQFTEDELFIVKDKLTRLYSTGDYQVKLRVTESYTDTILKFIDPATDYLSAETDFIIFTVN